MKNYIIIALIFLTGVAYSQTINNNWQQALTQEVEQFKACENTKVSGINSCNGFVGKALKTVYKVDDFYSEELSRHMLVSEISAYLKESKQWKLLGYGYEQKALNEAQQLANAKKAVVAVYINAQGLGQLSLIIPGALRPSGSWGFQVPNSASFFLSEPEKSYIDKGLSYSFERNLIKEVLIYARNY